MMYARKYGNTPSEQAYQFSKGVFSAGFQIPGIKDAADYFKANAYKANQTLEEATGATAKYVTDQVTSRLVPSIVSDLAKALDPVV